MVYVGNYDDLDSNSDSGSGDSGFGQLEESTITDIDNRIAYVYIRAHSALPVKSDRKGNFKDIDIYEIPDDMKVVKLTAAFNGDRNSTFYEYKDKKELIMNSIRECEEKNLKSPWKVAKKIEKDLKSFEISNNIPNAELRNVVSNDKIVLNKIIDPLPETELSARGIVNYMPVQILFYNKNNTSDIHQTPAYSKS